MENKKFGLLTVRFLSGYFLDKKGHKACELYFCECDCGGYIVARKWNLLLNRTKSCGCLKSKVVIERNKKLFTKHKLSKHPLYRTWASMKTRCYNPNHEQYKDYGGRGIIVCDRWLNSFELYYNDVGERPKGMTMDRIDNDGNYEPSNFKWSTRKQQINNRRIK